MKLFGEFERRYAKSHTFEQLLNDDLTEPTLAQGVSYNRRCHCWLFRDGVKIPDYLQHEKLEGRVICETKPSVLGAAVGEEGGGFLNTLTPQGAVKQSVQAAQR
jgi:hypothetical protein